MSTTKELGEAWFGCQAEIKHLKAVLKLKETHILTLKETIQSLKRKEMRRQQREQKRVAEKKEVKNPEKTLIYDESIGDLNLLCANCQRYLKTLGIRRGNRPLPKYKETNPKIFRGQKDGGGRGITRGHTRPQIQKSSEPINACQIDHKSSTCLSC